MMAVLERFGARFQGSGDSVVGTCARFRPATIDMMDFSARRDVLCGPLVSGATKVAIIAAATARGTSVIRHPHLRGPQAELLSFVSAAGVGIEVLRDRIVIEGRERFAAVSHTAMSDPVEIMTFIAAAVHAMGRVTLRGITVDRIKWELSHECEILDAMGVQLAWGQDDICLTVPPGLMAADVEATSLGVNTDVQPFFALMLTGASGHSTVEDRVWIHRFAYVSELNKLGCRIDASVGRAHIWPQRASIGSQTVVANDTRAGALLAIAALGITGTTTIEGFEHVYRGYESFCDKLRSLGAKVVERHGASNPKQLRDEVSNA
jgi:UDP-N-acetylglucosamine 1-carboxyvinyltransferase